MKRNKKLLLLLIMLLLSTNFYLAFGGTKEKNSLEKAKINGPVRKIILATYEGAIYDGTIILGKKLSNNKYDSYIEYDREGYKIKESYLGELLNRNSESNRAWEVLTTGYVIYQYNFENKLIKETVYSSGKNDNENSMLNFGFNIDVLPIGVCYYSYYKGKLFSTIDDSKQPSPWGIIVTDYFYNADGKLIEMKRGTRKDGSCMAKNSYKYDENGRVSEYQSITYDTDNTILLKTIEKYKYNENGDVIELADNSFNKDNKNTYSSVEYYKYNAYGHLVEKREKDSNDITTYKYEYDTYNNWTKRIELSNNKIVNVKTREYIYY